MDPSKETHRSVRAALIAETTLTDIVSTRIYDSVPAEPTFPYVKISIDDTVEDDNDCGKAWNVAVNIHAWSRAIGTIEVKELNAAIRTALDSVSSVTGFDLNFAQFAGSRVLEETDGRTTHGVVTFEFGISEV